MNYNIYMGDHAGGPVDYSAPVATATDADRAWTTPALPRGSATRIGVRSVDPATGLEESNVDCVVTVRIDADGNDVSLRPTSPLGLAAAPMGIGGLLVSWRYLGGGSAIAPTDFAVYATAGAAVSYAAPALVIPRGVGRQDYSAPIAGLIPGQAYAVAVRARGAGGGDDGNATVVRATTAGAAPRNVLDLTGMPTHGG
jgi:hypothetical protein